MPHETSAADTSSRFAPLTEAGIKQQTDEGSYSRGRSYWRNGHIVEPVVRGERLEAQCLGSEPRPYHVTATLAPAGKDRDNPLSASCTCPRGGFCKHIVALLLTWIHQPERFAERGSLADALGDKSHEELVALVERMVAKYPDLERMIDLPVPVAPDKLADAPASEVTIDAKAIRRQVRSALADYDAYELRYGWDSWGGGLSVPQEVITVLELGQGYVAAGQWANAEAVLAALAEEVVDVLPTINDENGEFSGVIIDADEGLAACLNAQLELPEDLRLSPTLREDLLHAIYSIWHCDIFDIGGIDLSQHGVEALIQNVTDEERAMVEGWLREERADSDWSKAALIGFLVDLRDAGGAGDEELLELYREAELWDEASIMLLSMERIDEAIATAARHTRLPGRLIAFADALLTYGEGWTSRAIALIDDRLWEIEGTKSAHEEDTLQRWLMAQYGAHGRAGDALAMAERRFERQPTPQTYREARQAASLPDQPDGTWTELRPKLIARLRKDEAWSALVDVFLDEGDIGAALDAFDRRVTQPRTGGWSGAYWGHVGQEQRLAQAAERDFPDRAVAIYRKLADALIDQKQRSAYKIAAEHLARVKITLERHGRADEWQPLISELRETNKRLRALQDELNQAGL